MDREFYQAAEAASNNIADAIEQLGLPIRVKNLGWSIFLIFDNQSILSVHPLTNGVCDVSGTDCFNVKIELEAIPNAEALEVITQVAALVPPADMEEQSVASAISPSAQPVAPSTKEESGLNWWKGKYPVGHASASLAEGRRKAKPGWVCGEGGPKSLPLVALSETTGSTISGSAPRTGSLQERIISPNIGLMYHSAILNHLQEVLPDEATIKLDDAGNINVERGLLKLVVQSLGANLYNVLTFILHNGEWTYGAPKKSQVTFGDCVRYVFDAVSAIDKAPKAQPEIEDDPEIDDEELTETAFQVLRELAREVGKPGDALHNPDLLDLKALGVATGSAHQAEAWQAVKTAFPSASLQGSTTHNGHPVSLNEHRDPSRPFADTLGGKKLVYLPGIGATLVDANDLPAKRYLSNGPNGVEWVEGEDRVNYKPRQWRGWGKR